MVCNWVGGIRHSIYFCRFTLLIAASFLLAVIDGGVVSAQKAPLESSNSAQRAEVRTEVRADIQNELRGIFRSVEALKQAELLREIFHAQLDAADVEGAVDTMNALLQLKIPEMSFWNLAQGRYYDGNARNDDYWNLAQLCDHPRLSVPDDFPDKRWKSQGVKSSMVLTLAHIGRIDECMRIIKTMAGTPETVKVADENYNPVGLNLANAYARVVDRLAKTGEFDKAVELIQLFTDPGVKRDVIRRISMSWLKEQKHPGAKEIVLIFQSVEPSMAVTEHENDLDAIQKLILQGELNQAKQEFLGLNKMSWLATQRAHQLAEAFRKMGNVDQCNEVLKECVKRAASESFYDFNDKKNFAQAFLECGDIETAVELIGNESSDEISTAMPLYQQPLGQYASRLARKSEHEAGLRIAKRIKDPYWRSATLESISRQMKDVPVGVRKQVSMEAVEVAKTIKNKQHRQIQLYSLIKYSVRSKPTQEVEPLLDWFEDPYYKAQVLASHAVGLIDAGKSDSVCQKLVPRIEALDRGSLSEVAGSLIYAKEFELAQQVVLKISSEDSADLVTDIVDMLAKEKPVESTVRFIDLLDKSVQGQAFQTAIFATPENLRAEMRGKYLDRIQQLPPDSETWYGLMSSELDSIEQFGLSESQMIRVIESTPKIPSARSYWRMFSAKLLTAIGAEKFQQLIRKIRDVELRAIGWYALAKAAKTIEDAKAIEALKLSPVESANLTLAICERRIEALSKRK